MAEKNLTVRIDEDFYRELKIKLAQDGRTLQSVAVELLKLYVRGNSDTEEDKGGRDC